MHMSAYFCMVSGRIALELGQVKVQGAKRAVVVSKQLFFIEIHGKQQF